MTIMARLSQAFDMTQSSACMSVSLVLPNTPISEFLPHLQMGTFQYFELFLVTQGEGNIVGSGTQVCLAPKSVLEFPFMRTGLIFIFNVIITITL